jgi:hypothetical protein
LEAGKAEIPGTGKDRVNSHQSWLLCQPLALGYDHINCGLWVVRVPGYRSRDPGFDTRHYQISREVMGVERGPLSLVSTIEELFGRKCSGSGLGYGHGDPLRCPRDTLYPEKLALTSLTSGGCSSV